MGKWGRLRPWISLWDRNSIINDSPHTGTTPLRSKITNITSLGWFLTRFFISQHSVKKEYLLSLVRLTRGSPHVRCGSQRDSPKNYSPSPLIWLKARWIKGARHGTSWLNISHTTPFFRHLLTSASVFALKKQGGAVQAEKGVVRD